MTRTLPPDVSPYNPDKHLALTAGTRLGSYEIVSALGAGGMGEVYRARDTKLNRHVAIKVLPDAFANDTDRLARFTREAQTLGALNHPHIAQIYGLEESSGVRALVMELVEGEDLSQRIARGAIPLDEALPIARQIAEALEAAHEQGIIHRDLKPANIKVTPDGVVKVLDFGLAKLKGANDTNGDNDSDARLQSPTITSPAMMTSVGVLLGTAAYMSPEQAKGREADKRSDVWAFGAVLYEMLTGRRAFDGEDMADVLGAVVRLEPNWETLSPDVTQPIRTLLQQCLIKDRRKRIADIAAATFVLDHQALVTSSSPPQGALPRASLRRRVATLTAAAALLVAAVGATLLWSATRQPLPAIVRTTITPSPSAAIMLAGSDRDIAITPDGSRVVYRGNNQLIVRALNQLEPTVLSGLGAPRGVFISPDGQWVGFFDGPAIKKVAITGGPPVLIASIPGGAVVSRGATWGPDGSIIFATNIVAAGLRRVSAIGGEPIALTTPNREGGEGYHLWPEFLPGGHAVLFTITPVGGNTADARVAVLDLQTGTSKELIRGGSDARYVRTGHLLYAARGTLRAVPFDLRRLEVIGTPAQVLEGVVTTLTGAADAAVAANGTLVYVPGASAFSPQQTVVSVDRRGRISALAGLPADSYRDVRVSPDGARLALATQDDVWIYDRTRATFSRLTTHPASDSRPLWTPDGSRIIFRSNRAGYPELFWRPADGTGSDEPLFGRAKDFIDLRADGWSADGTALLFTEVPPTFQGAIGQIAIDRPSEAKMLVKNEFYNEFPAVSPDGRWIAYESNVSGQYEIYVERYPELGHRQPISTGGGRLPLWSRNGRELFFSSLDSRHILTVPMQTGATLVAGRSQVLFDFDIGAPAGGSRRYDIAPDGSFLMIRGGHADAGSNSASNLILVQNWFEELKRLVPVSQ